MVQSLDRSQGRVGGERVHGRRPQPPPSPAIARCSIEEPLIFEMGQPGRCGVDLPEPPKVRGPPRRPAPHAARSACRASASRRSCATTRGSARRTTPSTSGVYPLGSCTMKHNPRLNEKMARLPGFGDLHPLQPQSTVQGALELIDRAGALAEDADRHAGRGDVAQGRRPWRAVRHDGDPRRARGARRASPRKTRAGAGIRARHQSGDRRLRSASPSKTIPANDRRPRRPRRAEGRARPRRRGDHADQPQHLRPVRARDHRDLPTAVHEAGAYFYCDGANFNAIVGRVRPGDLGIDCDAHQPAQDLLDAAWRRRAGRRAGGAVGGAGALSRRYPWIVKDGERLRALIEDGAEATAPAASAA